MNTNIIIPYENKYENEIHSAILLIKAKINNQIIKINDLKNKVELILISKGNDKIVKSKSFYQCVKNVLSKMSNRMEIFRIKKGFYTFSPKIIKAKFSLDKTATYYDLYKNYIQDKTNAVIIKDKILISKNDFKQMKLNDEEISLFLNVFKQFKLIDLPTIKKENEFLFKLILGIKHEYLEYEDYKEYVKELIYSYNLEKEYQNIIKQFGKIKGLKSKSELSIKFLKGIN